MCKNNGVMVTRCRRYNALKLSCMTTKYVFRSPIFNPKPRNCPHQIDPFPARNNPSNACLCVLPPALLSANRVWPLNETVFQSTHYQMKWRLANCNGITPIVHRQACDVSSLSDILRAVRTDEIFFFPQTVMNRTGR